MMRNKCEIHHTNECYMFDLHCTFIRLKNIGVGATMAPLPPSPNHFIFIPHYFRMIFIYVFVSASPYSRIFNIKWRLAGSAHKPSPHHYSMILGMVRQVALLQRITVQVVQLQLFRMRIRSLAHPSVEPSIAKFREISSYAMNRPSRPNHVVITYVGLIRTCQNHADIL